MSEAVQEKVQNVTVTIDGVPVSVPKGTLLVEAAKQIKRDIPVYCYHPKMGPAGLCRICLVDVEGMPKLQIACNTPVADGMVVHTQNEKAAGGRRAVLELYLVNHPLDCPICDKGGECDLQDYAMAYGQDYSRSVDPKVSKPKAVDLGPTIVLDEERCVVCQRCVRFDELIVGDEQLVLKDRGARNIIATATGDPYRHNFTGNVTELCPVGALTSKTYRFRSRPWDLRRTQTTCTQCSVGCQLFADTRVGALARTMSVEDDAISDSWLCDRGRYNIGYLSDVRRLTQPLYKHDGRFMQIGWDDAFALWATALREAPPESAGVLGGGRLTNEEAYLLQHVFRARGVRNLDWRVGRQRQATPGREGGSLADLEMVDAIVVVGEPPGERAPVMDLRIRKAVRKGGVRIDANGGNVLAALPKGASRIALVWDGVDAQQVRVVMKALGTHVEVATYITGEQGNARGAEAMGVHPKFAPGYATLAQRDAGMDFQAMIQAARQGKMRVLSILGANPVLHSLDGPAVREALAKTPFVAVSELFMTQTAELATLVLPAKGAFEKSGTTTNLSGDVLPRNAATGLTIPDGPLSDQEVLVGLAQALGVTLPTQEDLDAAVIRHLAVAPEAFTLGDERFAFAGDSAALPVEGGLRVEVRTRIFAGGGTIAHDERLAALVPLPEAALHSGDAARLHVTTGDCVDLRCGERVMHDLLVEVRDDVTAGSVQLIGGLPDDPANLFGADACVEVENARSLTEEVKA